MYYVTIVDDLIWVKNTHTEEVESYFASEICEMRKAGIMIYGTTLLGDKVECRELHPVDPSESKLRSLVQDWHISELESKGSLVADYLAMCPIKTKINVRYKDEGAFRHFSLFREAYDSWFLKTDEDVRGGKSITSVAAAQLLNVRFDSMTDLSVSN